MKGGINMTAEKIYEEAESLSYLEEKVEKCILSSLQNIPEEISSYFFERTIDDLDDLNVDDQNNQFAKKIYNAYMVGFSVGVRFENHQSKNNI